MPELHDYQRIAVQHLHENRRAGLFLDMGLGKTAVTLSALTEEHLPALVVAPKRVAENVWEPEQRKWRPDLTIRVAAGTKDVRERALADVADLTILGRDNLRDALPHADTYRTLILDELSSFKTKASVRWRAARKLSKGKLMRHVWGLTGTPSPNGLMDLWAQIYLLDHGDRLGTTLGQYRARYFTPGRQLANGVITEWHLRPGADKVIHKTLSDICISMDTEGRVQLPPVTVNRVEVPLPAKVKNVYRQMRDTLVADLDVLGGEVHTAMNAAVLSSKLSQIAAGFMYGDDAEVRGGVYDVLHREKVRALQEILEGTGSPVLVFYRFRAEAEMIREALGDQVHLADEPNLQERWNNREFPVLLARPASIGHGLNLQHGGHTIVWTSLTWSLEEWQQGNKRLARQGQKRPVVIHTLEAPRTVDNAIFQRLEQKTSVQDALMHHLQVT